ncbi:hypothetical protein [Bacillus alkalicellulosilyticus]|uniref:hypothetical protein n=1 Tax=Alkalihalobacterium alkalicellulosilyticum TaxID=1912214 RepID=UPI000998C1AE|nr:hypothetical protein [Bacillus alkalicellulosilyticus]
MKGKYTKSILFIVVSLLNLFSAVLLYNTTNSWIASFLFIVSGILFAYAAYMNYKFQKARK